MAQCRASRRAANQCLVDLWRQFALLLSTPCVDLDALTFLLLPLTNQHKGSEIVNITIASWHRVLNPLIWASQPQEGPTNSGTPTQFLTAAASPVLGDSSSQMCC